MIMVSRLTPPDLSKIQSTVDWYLDILIRISFISLRSLKMSAAVKIESAHVLKMSTLEDLDENLTKKLCVNLPDEDDDSLQEHDFVQWVVSIGENKYNFYHGFPGDNPMGILVDLKNTKVLAVVGEGGSDIIDEDNESIAAFVAYYDMVTEEACNYEMKEFRTSEILRIDNK